MKTFKKANRNGLTAFIPFYHLLVLIEICNLPKMYFAFLLIPIVHIPFFYKVNKILAKQFRKDEKYGFFMIFLPIIIGFGKSEYAGISLVGMDSSNQVSEIAEIDENKNKEIVVEENTEADVANKNIDISIGGGKYQKEYISNLDSMNDERIITQEKDKDKKQDNNSSIFIAPKSIEEKEKEEEKKQDIFNVEFIETPKKEKKVEIDQFSEFFDCPNCGTKLKRGSKSCFICGTNF